MQESYNTLSRRREALIKKMSQGGPFLMGTPTWLQVRCGNPRCACAKDRKKRHEKLHLSWTEAQGRNGTLYVPVNLRKEVLEWVENYWVLKDRMREMTEISRKMIRLYSTSQKKKKG